MANGNSVLLIILLDIVLGYFNFAHADLPTHALYLDIIGEWKAYISEPVSGGARYCGATKDVSKTGSQLTSDPSEYIKDTYGLEKVMLFKLAFHSVTLRLNKSNRDGWKKLAVLDGHGKTIGVWTAVYNTGFEIILSNGASLFFYLDYEKVGNMKYMTHPDSAKIGWLMQMDSKEGAIYRCASAVKLEESGKRRYVKLDPFRIFQYRSGYRNPKRRIAKMARQIRRVYSSSAEFYPCTCENNGMPRIWDLQIRFLWHIFKKVSVINDGKCMRSYYSAVIQVVQAKMLKAGMSGVLDPDLYAKDIYNQGCNGGDPYLVGKMGKELGFSKRSISGARLRSRVYLDDYGYLSGCYQCTQCKGEEVTMREILESGPVVAMIDSTALPKTLGPDDIVGIPSLRRKQDGVCEVGRSILSGWEPTNHAIVLYGWGEVHRAGKNVKVWYARNSWGKDWGQDGNFKIIRGINYFGVESRVMYVDLSLDPKKRSRPPSVRNSLIL